MHKDCEQDDNRQRNAQQPQQSAFTKTHGHLHFVFVKTIRAFQKSSRWESAQIPTARQTLARRPLCDFRVFSILSGRCRYQVLTSHCLRLLCQSGGPCCTGGASYAWALPSRTIGRNNLGMGAANPPSAAVSQGTSVPFLASVHLRRSSSG